MKNGYLQEKSYTEKIFYFFLLALTAKVIFSALSYYLILWIYNIDLSLISINSTLTPAAIRAYKLATILDQIGTFLIPVLVFLKLFYKRPYEIIAFNRLKKSHLILLPTLLIIMICSSFWILEINQNIDFSFLPKEFLETVNIQQDFADQIHQSFIGASSKSLLVNLIIMALLPAFCEELAFRGVLQELFIKWSRNIPIGIFISATIFALLHFQINNIFALLFLGALLGYIRLKTKTIWTTIILHFSYNSYSVLSIFLLKNEIDISLNEHKMAMTILLLISVIVLTTLNLYKKKGLKSP